MPFTPISVATNNIAGLDDQPNDVGGLTSAQLKAKFDKFGVDSVAWFNATHLAELTPTNIGAETPAGAQTRADAVQTNLNTHSADLTAHGADKQFLFRQAIINGNFDVWQRGITFSGPNGVYTADRYSVIDSADSNVKILRSTTVPNARSKYSMRAEEVIGVGLGGAFSDISYLVEDYQLFAGQVVTLSGYIKCDAGVTVTPRVEDGIGLTSGVAITSTSWVPFSVTRTVDNSATKLSPVIRFNRSGIAVGIGVNIAQLQLNVGNVVLPFSPKSTDDENKGSMRYAWIPQVNSTYIRMSSYTANVLIFDIPLPVQLRANPTIRGTIGTDFVVYNMAGVAQSGFIGAYLATSNGVRVTMTKSGHALVDATLEVKTTSGFEAEL